MRVLVVGASGRLGSGVVAALADRHEVVAASRTGEHHVDLTNPASIAGLYSAVGPVDAVACTAGKTPYGPLAELSSDQWLAGVRDKLLGQVELVRLGLPHVTDGGSWGLQPPVRRPTSRPSRGPAGASGRPLVPTGPKVTPSDTHRLPGAALGAEAVPRQPEGRGSPLLR